MMEHEHFYFQRGFAHTDESRERRGEISCALMGGTKISYKAAVADVQCLCRVQN